MHSVSVLSPTPSQTIPRVVVLSARPLQSINVPVFEMGNQANPVDIARAGIEAAKAQKMDVVIVDTAGRLQVSGEGGCRWVHDARDL